MDRAPDSQQGHAAVLVARPRDLYQEICRYLRDLPDLEGLERAACRPPVIAAVHQAQHEGPY